jgi:hypothetical protein
MSEFVLPIELDRLLTIHPEDDAFTPQVQYIASYINAANQEMGEMYIAYLLDRMKIKPGISWQIVNILREVRWSDNYYAKILTDLFDTYSSEFWYVLLASCRSKNIVAQLLALSDDIFPGNLRMGVDRV